MSIPSTTTPETPSPDRGDQLRAEALRRLYQGLDGELRWVPLLPAILVGGMWVYVDHAWLLAWLAAALVVPGWRYLLSRRYRAMAPGPSQTRYWAWHLAATTAADGIVWGIAGWAFFVPQALPPQLILFAMIVGIPAGSIFTNSWWPVSLHAFSVPSIGLTALGLIWGGTPSHLALAVGLLVYLAILFQIMHQAHAAAMETISLRFENVELIEELRHEKAVADEANIAKSKFLAAASHDLRQPLHALGLFVAALNERVKQAEAGVLMVNINRSVSALEGLFNALLDISKLDAGTIEPSVRDFALAPLLSQLTAEYEPQVQAQGLSWRCNGGDVVVRSDPALLETILRNLISNAIRYTRKGYVGIECRAADEGVILAVNDSGIGIAPEHQREIFQEFVQLHNPERDRTKGLGLGLAIVDRLTRLLHHPLTLNSTQDRGSQFRLTLPRGEAVAALKESMSQTDSAEPVEAGMLVLVIDDEAAVRDAMSVLLGDWGYETMAVASIDEALASLDRRPDAIIADYRLRAELTGIEAIRTLHRHYAWDIPALIVTGDTASERIVQARDSGFAFLHKPVPPAKLRAFLRVAGGRRTTPV